MKTAQIFFFLLVAGVMAGCSKEEEIAIELVKIPQTATMEKGQFQKLSVSVFPENITKKYTLLWESSDDAIATVDANGSIKAVKAGTATITIYEKNNPLIKSECEITVMPDAFDYEGTFKGTMSIRAKGVQNPLDAPSADFNDVLVQVEALSATQLKYSCTQAPTSTTVFGFTVEATVDLARNGNDITYYTGEGQFTVDSLKAGGVHAYTIYAGCTAQAKPSRLGSILEMDHPNNGGRLVYRAWEKL